MNLMEVIILSQPRTLAVHGRRILRLLRTLDGQLLVLRWLIPLAPGTKTSKMPVQMSRVKSTSETCISTRLTRTRFQAALPPGTHSVSLQHLNGMQNQKC